MWIKKYKFTLVTKCPLKKVVKEKIFSQIQRRPLCTKIIKYKDVSSESGVGVRENFSLVWLVSTNHGA
jgi:hypothetical protein